ncbi:VOC family protein [Rhodobacteraceae bacterium RKSG542]|nr:VOC family protein [Pseudovibrio flavus]
MFAVASLEAAAAIWEKAGFTLTPVANHPWGTHNRLVQLDGWFLEILGIGNADLIQEAGEGELSFGAFNRDFLKKREGGSMLVLDSVSAEEDRIAYEQAGLKPFAPFSFERIAKAPDGSEKKVAFDLTITADPLSSDSAYFTCHNKYPENFWKEEFQKHQNTAKALSSVILVADNPADHHEFLRSFIGTREARLSSLGLDIPTARGSIIVRSPSAFEAIYGVKAPVGDAGLKIAAVSVEVDSIQMFKNCVISLGGKDHNGFHVVEADEMGGLALIATH